MYQLKDSQILSTKPSAYNQTKNNRKLSIDVESTGYSAINSQAIVKIISRQ